MLNKLTLLLIICSCSAIYAQDYRPGYIIKANGDSINGFINNSNPQKITAYCNFKTSRNNPKEVFSPDQLKGFGIFDYKYFRSKTFFIEKGKKVSAFVEVLLRGKASLYRYQDFFLVEKDSMIFLPQPGYKKIQTVVGEFLGKDLKYIGLLNALMKECDLVANKIKYDERNLTNLIRNFNRCLGSESQETKINKPWTHFSPSIFLAFDQATTKISGFESYSINQSISMPVGIGVEISSPRTTDKVFLSLELWYVKQVFQGYSESSSGGLTTRNDLYVHPNFVKIPVSIKYNFRSENSTPYFKLGLSNYFLSSIKCTLLSETENSGYVVTKSQAVPLDTKVQTGIWMGVGYSRKVNHSINTFAEFRYEINNAFVKSSTGSLSSGTALNVLIGLRF